MIEPDNLCFTGCPNYSTKNHILNNLNLYKSFPLCEQRNMEQKPMDDEEFSGEEFLDENDFTEDEIVIENAKPKDQLKEKKKIKVKKNMAEKKEAKVEEEGWIEVGDFSREKNREDKKEVYDVSSNIPMTGESGSSEPILPADSWNSEEKSISENTSSGTTWKVVAAILLVLLIVSVFTNGFRFGNSSPTGGSILTLAQAQNTALNYVNTNLLQPPLLATVQEATDSGNVYRVTLSVAGQSVDSYITKDGVLFFPQGFNTTVSLQDEMAKRKENQPAPASKQLNDSLVIADDEINLSAPVSDTSDDEVSPSTPTADYPTEFTIKAKKWLFTPNKITVEKGKEITFIIEPQDLEFTFSLPAFNVNEKITGPTTMTFTADKAGTFLFLCSSCEDFRGMMGTIVVESPITG